MKTKIYKIIAFVTIAQLCLYACCEDDFNVFITTLELTAKDTADDDSASVANENFSLIVRPDYDIQMASVLNKKSGFMNTANATSCGENYTVIKSVTGVEVKADVPLFGIAAGELLNEHVVVIYAFTDEEFPLSDILPALNYGAKISNEYTLKFNTPIPSATTVNFTFIITFENGDQIERTATEVTFE